MPTGDIRQLLPSVDAIIKSDKASAWLGIYPRSIVLKAIRETIDDTRAKMCDGSCVSVEIEVLYQEIEERIKAFVSYSLMPVINATGIVIHTNLGRSVLSEDIMEHVKGVACGYSTLEYDLERGQRGKRYVHVQRLLREITGAEDAVIVNNNAAAVFVCLRELAKGKEVIVSRGELVEIGGSFRVPDVMAESGAILREVGTTNKTHLYDYERAINDNTALLLKVHQSNFRTIGFTKLVEIEDLVQLGKRRGIPVMFDLGSGCLVDLKPYGIHIEPTVQETLRSGCDIVTFSGDKLLGGPQGGVIAGKKALIERVSKNPLMRAIRVDKLTLSAFEATLLKYLDLQRAKAEVPTLRMILQDIDTIKMRAEGITEALKGQISPAIATIRLIEDESQAGGGSLPEVTFKTYATEIRPFKISVNNLEERLRLGEPPVIARIKDDGLLIDARTVQDREVEPLVDAVSRAVSLNV